MRGRRVNNKPVTETLNKNKNSPQVMVVPVEAEHAEAPQAPQAPQALKPPPPPPTLERQTNKNADSREEAFHEVAEPDEYDKVVDEPIAPVVMKPLTRVDKLRMLARNGLP